MRSCTELTPRSGGCAGAVRTSMTSLLCSLAIVAKVVCENAVWSAPWAPPQATPKAAAAKTQLVWKCMGSFGFRAPTIGGQGEPMRQFDAADVGRAPALPRLLPRRVPLQFSLE